MGSESTPIDPSLFELTSILVSDGLEHLQNLITAGASFMHQFGPSLRVNYEKSGLPSFTKDSTFMPKYGGFAFLPGGETKLWIDELQGFKNLCDYLCSNQRLKECLDFEVMKNFGFPDVEKHAARDIIENLVNRYIYAYRTCSFSKEKLASIYLPYEAGLLRETLSADFVVPILGLIFDSDQIELGTNFFIRCMDTDFQLARMCKLANADTFGEHERAAGAATHALVLTCHKLANKIRRSVRLSFSEISTYPIQSIDYFFSAIRIVAGVDTGYAQLLVRPIGWTYHYMANFPPIEGTTTRKYPSKLKSIFWSQSVPTITSQQVERVKHVFNKLISLNCSKLEIATRRLNYCLLRDNEEDAILDATIGLEALLSDGNQEMTHKLALRLAALVPLSTTHKQSPVKVFHNMKKIYDNRSAISHGKLLRDTRLTIPNGEQVSIATAAVEYLRMALGVLADHPKYLAPNKIDEDLILGKLACENDPPAL